MSSKLFLEHYLDEDVSVLVAELVRARGFSATTTLKSGNLGTSDAEQLRFATASGMTLLTHNRVDFERLAIEYFEQNLGHCGIIIAARRPPNEIAGRLLSTINDITSEEMRNQIRYI
jgi:hypothetical protein